MPQRALALPSRVPMDPRDGLEHGSRTTALRRGRRATAPECMESDGGRTRERRAPDRTRDSGTGGCGAEAEFHTWFSKRFQSYIHTSGFTSECSRP